MQPPMNLAALLGEIAGYTQADVTILGVSEPHRAAVARRLVTGFAALPQTPLEHGYRLRLDEAARSTPRA